MERLLNLIKERNLLVLSPNMLKQCGLEASDVQTKSLNALRALADQEIRKFPFNTVSKCWFQLYTETSIAQAFIEIGLHKDCAGHSLEVCEQNMSKAIELLDYALIIAGGYGHEEDIQAVLEMLRPIVETMDESREALEARPSKRRKLNGSGSQSWLPTNLLAVPQLTRPVGRLQTPSFDEFECHMHKFRQPILLGDAIEHWPALQKWRSSEYWLKQTLGGRRLVPVEIGQSYTDDNWKQEIMPFGKFLEQYVINADHADDVGYLAQHDLMTQIPELRKDITIPDYCYCNKPREEVPVNAIQNPGRAQTNERNSDFCSHSSPADGMQSSGLTSDAKSVDARQAREEASPSYSLLPASSRDTFRDQKIEEDEEADYSSAEDTIVHQNIWIGGRTVSPLHHDPYHNILCQVHGTKYVRLYSPQYSSDLYARSSKEPALHVSSTGGAEENVKHTIDMSNNSQIDVYAMELSPSEDWNERWPGINEVPYLECLLEPGQALYIPKGWWHYVRACSIGISVSFWW